MRGWRLESLTARVAIMLSVALLPLGLIAVLQTDRAVDAAHEAYRATLAAQTERAARPEREAIVEAFGVAKTLADALTVLEPRSEACADLMARTMSTEPQYQFVGFVSPPGISECNNQRQRFDFSQGAETSAAFDDPRPMVTFNPAGAASGMPVVVISQPVHDLDDDFRGFISLSFAGRELVATREAASISSDVKLVTFNDRGEVLTSDVPEERLADILPRNLALSDFVDMSATVFASVTEAGEPRNFSLVPIIPGRAYALGSWAPVLQIREPGAFALSTLMFPLLMWLVTLIVAIVALQRQVVRPIRTLRRRMRAFADRRTLLQGNPIATAPSELREIGDTFETMANQIVHDEAELEHKLHERGLLLREVHHRVKNNLQLMSSIINMQIRQEYGAEAEEALRSLQGRLASLAKFHQDLYQTSSLSRLRADQLLADLASQMVGMAVGPARQIDLRLEMEKIVLSPDQASPLAMLATEALTNALKYASADAGTPLYLRMSLALAGDGEDSRRIHFEVENSVASDTATSPGTGLGTRLINAFASQLDARVKRHFGAGSFTLAVDFRRQAFTFDEDAAALEAVG